MANNASVNVHTVLIWHTQHYMICRHLTQTWFSVKRAGQRCTTWLMAGFSLTISFLRKANVTSISFLTRDSFGFVFIISLTRTSRATSMFWSFIPSGKSGRKFISPFLDLTLRISIYCPCKWANINNIYLMKPNRLEKSEHWHHIYYFASLRRISFNIGHFKSHTHLKIHIRLCCLKGTYQIQ